MRVDKGDFVDPRVRKAMKLAIDRTMLIESAQAGFGTVANDLLGVGTEYFADDLKPPPFDVEQAKSLLKQAGKEGLTFTLPTSNVVPGFTEAATLYSQQLKQAGITANLETVPASEYYVKEFLGPNSRQFGQDISLILPSLAIAYQTYFARNATYAETHWGEQPGGAAALKLIEEATAAVDPMKAAELWHEVQQEQYEEGGTIVWCNRDSLDLLANNVRGFAPGPGWGLNNFSLQDGWLT
jgi:peptide/nickel transport system substrate-binding protein